MILVINVPCRPEQSQGGERLMIKELVPLDQQLKKIKNRQSTTPPHKTRRGMVLTGVQGGLLISN